MVHRVGMPIWLKSTFAFALITAVVATAFYVTPRASEAGVPQYQRAMASEEACKAAGVEISKLRLQPTIKFVDDCVLPNVTPVTNEPGHLIVIRVVEVQVGRGTVQRKTYSALMDGQRIDAWKMIQVQSAPNKLTVVISPYAPAAGG